MSSLDRSSSFLRESPAILQACINGARPIGFHPTLPLTPDEMARDAAACIRAGATELHLHPRDGLRRESLKAVDATLSAIRFACPGTLVGVSTGAWIEADEQRTRECIQQWQTLPDYASVNLSEQDAPAVMRALQQRGVGIEAGLASVDDAKRFVAMTERPQVLRVLIELEQQNFYDASSIVFDIVGILNGAQIDRQILLHGFDATVWQFIELSKKHHWSTRIGLEDTCLLPDGTRTQDNAELVATAISA